MYENIIMKHIILCNKKRKYLQIVYLTRGYFSKYVTPTVSNSIVKKKTKTHIHNPIKKKAKDLNIS
jgi:hypothetical protein